MSKIAVCQPYFAPYLGYFQLINEVDMFVMYDDVSFIKGGWINRNKIFVNGQEKLFCIPLKKQSSFKKINETMIDWDNKITGKFIKTLEMSYSNSKYRTKIIPMVREIFNNKPQTISELSINSIKIFCEYLKIETPIKISSVENYQKEGDKTKNLINICEQENKKHYINPIGGVKLYSKEEFLENGIKLNFLKGTPSLSIIDVCMNFSKDEIRNKLTDCRLI